MNVTVIPLTEFVHGSITAHEGRPLEIDADTAAALERDGLVRIRADSVPAKKAMPAGKPEGDGAGQPSSALPAAPVLPKPTLPVSKRGAVKHRGKGKR